MAHNFLNTSVSRAEAKCWQPQLWRWLPGENSWDTMADNKRQGL